MAVRTDDKRSRHAQSFYEVLERFDGFATLRIVPKTGRTHQIRVHLASIHCPVLCDRQYGGRSQITRAEIRREPGRPDRVAGSPCLARGAAGIQPPRDGRASGVGSADAGRFSGRVGGAAGSWRGAALSGGSLRNRKRGSCAVGWLFPDP